jgi:LacI family transcriptional regulator
MRKKRTTLRDVAEQANVSTAVVSYVINDGPRPTSPEVRARVRQAIIDLDYHPNGFARGLRARRSHTIGFIAYDFFPFDSFVSHYLSLILTAFTAELKQHGYYMLMYPLNIGEDLTPLDQLLRSGRVDGVVLRLVQDPPATDDLLRLITKAEIPCVCIERPAGAAFEVTSITYDDLGGAYAATQHLIGKGHRRIAHLEGDPRVASAQARKAGYGRALAEHGIPVDERLIRVAHWNMVEASIATRDLMQLAEPPTAIFAASDDMALGSLETLRAMGISTPDEVAVVGFDGIPLGQSAMLPLTSIRIPLTDIGQRAARTLIQGPERASDLGSHVFPVELLVGSTT